LRQYRPPTKKAKGAYQANFESRSKARLGDKWQNDGHFDIIDIDEQP
jgi:hypothetical protein